MADADCIITAMLVGVFTGGGTTRPTEELPTTGGAPYVGYQVVNGRRRALSDRRHPLRADVRRASEGQRQNNAGRGLCATPTHVPLNCQFARRDAAH